MILPTGTNCDWINGDAVASLSILTKINFNVPQRRTHFFLLKKSLDFLIRPPLIASPLLFPFVNDPNSNSSIDITANVLHQSAPSEPQPSIIHETPQNPTFSVLFLGKFPGCGKVWGKFVVNMLRFFPKLP